METQAGVFAHAMIGGFGTIAALSACAALLSAVFGYRCAPPAAPR
jgi:hypothetical protein